MELNKEKYSKNELENIIKQLSLEYENELKSQKERIFELVEKEKSLQAELNTYKNRDELIKLTLVKAEEKAGEINEVVSLKYNSEVNYLKELNRKIRVYFNYLSKKNTGSNYTEEELEFTKKLEDILDTQNKEKEKLIELDKSISKVVAFNPKEKVENYLDEKQEKNGFSLEEVLNPGKLDLEELCKELGVMDGKVK